jgi:C-terminal processing protease CtpA/Prc
MTLVVEAPGGTRREITVPEEADPVAMSCADPLGRRTDVTAETSVLADGTAVIRLPSFLASDEPFPDDPALIDAYEDRLRTKILTAFETVKSAPRLIWDVRGNAGGLTRVGLTILSGMLGATPEVGTYCTSRIQNTSPPQFGDTQYAQYSLTPGGPFSYPGRVAVLVDGSNYSAADYFAYFARYATPALLVGTPTSGAYGASSGQFAIDSTLPHLVFGYDVNRCVNAASGSPLELFGVPPHMSIEYAPADLAAGRDTVLEAAVRALSQ